MRVEKRKRLIPLMAVGFLLLSVMATSAKTIRYVYDDLNRLEYVYYGDGMILRYIYDEVGNREKQIVTITDTTAPSTTTSTPEGLYNSD